MSEAINRISCSLVLVYAESSVDTQGGGGGRGHIGLGVQDNGLAAVDAETQYIAQLNIIPLFRIISTHLRTHIYRTHPLTHAHTTRTCTHAPTPTPHTCYLFVCSYVLVVSILLLFTLSRSLFHFRSLCVVFSPEVQRKNERRQSQATAKHHVESNNKNSNKNN